MVAPLVALIPVFAALLDMRAEAAMTNRIARAPIIGRPVGAPEWIATRERRLGRPLAPGKPGPQPRMQPDPRDRVALKLVRETDRSRSSSFSIANEAAAQTASSSSGSSSSIAS